MVGIKGLPWLKGGGGNYVSISPEKDCRVLDEHCGERKCGSHSRKASFAPEERKIKQTKENLLCIRFLVQRAPLTLHTRVERGRDILIFQLRNLWL